MLDLHLSNPGAWIWVLSVPVEKLLLQLTMNTPLVLPFQDQQQQHSKRASKANQGGESHARRDTCASQRTTLQKSQQEHPTLSQLAHAKNKDMSL